jgi:hypothetical protein
MKSSGRIAARDFDQSVLEDDAFISCSVIHETNVASRPFRRILLIVFDTKYRILKRGDLYLYPILATLHYA